MTTKELKNICDYVNKEKILVKNLNNSTYISTENMLQNKKNVI